MAVEVSEHLIEQRDRPLYGRVDVLVERAHALSVRTELLDLELGGALRALQEDLERSARPFELPVDRGRDPATMAHRFVDDVRRGLPASLEQRLDRAPQLFAPLTARGLPDRLEPVRELDDLDGVDAGG